MPMPLPTLVVPEYETVLPFGQKVTYRPFLVREEKLLYLAMESQDQKEMIKAVKEIIKNCTSIKEIDTLSTFDVEFLFLRIRAKSVGEISEFKITCPDDDKTQVDVEVNLEQVEVQVPDDHTNKIKITDDVTLVMKYPSIDTFVKNNLSENPGMDDIFQLAADCVSQIANGEEVEDAKAPQAELVNFFESMNSAQFQMVQKFFETMPKLSHTIEVFNPKTEVKSEVVLEGMGQAFRVALAHDSLINLFEVNFALMQHHKYSLTELENMMPWERDVYVNMLIRHLQEEEARQRQASRGQSL